MAEIAVKPFVMRNAIVTLGSPGDDYAAACSSATLTPAGGTTDFKGLKKTAVFTFPLAVTWTLDLTFGQDWSVATSLSRWLFDHIGETVPFTMNPNATEGVEGETTWAGQVAITAGAIGGDVDAVATSDVSLGVVGQPVPTFAAATP